MKKKTLLIALVIVLALAVGAGAAAYARSSAGSESDPLVTLSYLEEVFEPALLEKVESLVGGQRGSAAEGTFAVVTLSAGQRLEGESGCEILLRAGSCTALGDSAPALVDTSSGGELLDGEGLVRNHLYMVTVSGSGLRAGSVGATVLVSGEYEVFG